ncbi:MAG: hypothetical protein JWO73_718 [Candidatus Taylorbacteria bacterium]|nr:hypothetical protein [Candidatus Taylorbacteria bacterium]
MKKLLFLSALVFQGLFTSITTQAQLQPLLVLSGSAEIVQKDERISIGTNRTIKVVFSCGTPTNAYGVLLVSHLSDGYPWNDTWLRLGNQDFAAGSNTNTYVVPTNIIGADRFSIQLMQALPDHSVVPFAESEMFFIEEAPAISVSLTEENRVWKRGETKEISFIWENLKVGDPYWIVMGFAQNHGWQGEAYGFTLHQGIFDAESGSKTISVIVPTNMAIGEHFVRVSSPEAYNFLTETVYGAPTNIPTASRISGINVGPMSSEKPSEVSLDLEGIPGHTYQVQMTTNFVDWTTFTNSPVGSPSGYFYFDRWITNDVNSFYRLKEIPYLNVSFTVSPEHPHVNEPVTWTAVVSGGDGPYYYGWTAVDGLTGEGSTFTDTYGNSSAARVKLNVKSGDQQVTISCTVPIIEN